MTSIKQSTDREHNEKKRNFVYRHSTQLHRHCIRLKQLTHIYFTTSYCSLKNQRLKSSNKNVSMISNSRWQQY